MSETCPDKAIGCKGVCSLCKKTLHKCPDIDKCGNQIFQTEYEAHCVGNYHACSTYIWRREPPKKTPFQWSKQQ